jgi:hypothetical protein
VITNEVGLLSSAFVQSIIDIFRRGSFSIKLSKYLPVRIIVQIWAPQSIQAYSQMTFRFLIIGILPNGRITTRLPQISQWYIVSSCIASKELL